MASFELHGTDYDRTYGGTELANALFEGEQALRSQSYRKVVPLYECLDSEQDSAAGAAVYGGNFPANFDLQDEGARLMQASPFFGTWLDTISEVVWAASTPEEKSWATQRHLRYLGNYIIAAAIRTDKEVRDVAVQSHDGRVTIPELGSAVLSSGPILASVRDGALHLSSKDRQGNQLSISLDEADGEHEAWLPLRSIESEGMRIMLNDLDPYRKRFSFPVSERLDEETYDYWQRTFDEACGFIRSHDPELFNQLRVCLTTIVPAPAEPLTEAKSMANGAAYGVMAISKPSDPVRLATHLANGLRKNQLLALRTQASNFCRGWDDPGATDRRYLPGHSTPGAASHFLDDAFLSAGMAQFYHSLLRDQAIPKRYTQLSLLRWYKEAMETSARLRQTSYLLPNGKRFLDTVEQELTDVAEVVAMIPSEIQDIIEAAAYDHALSWRLHNVLPSPWTIEAMTQAWQEGQSPANIAVSSPSLTASMQAFGFVGQRERYVLAEVRLKEPSLFQQWHAEAKQTNEDGALEDLHKAGNIDLITGNIGTARQHFLSLIMQHPARTEAWIGWMLTYHNEQSRPAIGIARHPELVMHTYVGLLRRQGKTTSAPPRPEVLAAWFSAMPEDTTIRQRFGLPDLASSTPASDT